MRVHLIDKFHFRANISNSDKLNTFVIKVPTGITSKSSLFEFFKKFCKLPPYFGRNWDAFEEILKDFHWLKEKDIAIIHNDLPLATDIPNVKIYLEILLGSIVFWEHKNSHKLYIAFPAILKDMIKRIF